MNKLLLITGILSLSVSLSSVTAQADEIFKDMDGHWSKEVVEWGKSLGTINGYPDNTFRPDNTISEAEFLAILIRKFGKVSITPTGEDWAEAYYKMAQEKNYPVKGVEDKNLRSAPVKRLVVAEIITGAQGYNYQGDDAIRFILNKNYAQGKSTIERGSTIHSYMGEDFLTRAEALQFIKTLEDKGFGTLETRPHDTSDRTLLKPLSGEVLPDHYKDEGLYGAVGYKVKDGTLYFTQTMRLGDYPVYKDHALSSSVNPDISNQVFNVANYLYSLEKDQMVLDYSQRKDGKSLATIGLKKEGYHPENQLQENAFILWFNETGYDNIIAEISIIDLWEDETTRFVDYLHNSLQLMYGEKNGSEIHSLIMEQYHAVLVRQKKLNLPRQFTLQDVIPLEREWRDNNTRLIERKTFDGLTVETIESVHGLKVNISR